MVEGEYSSAGEVVDVALEAKGGLISAGIVCLQGKVTAVIRAVLVRLLSFCLRMKISDFSRSAVKTKHQIYLSA